MAIIIVIEVCMSTTLNLRNTEMQKNVCYQNLTTELKNIWKQQAVQMVPIVIVVDRVVTVCDFV